ncbi:fidgetin-like protein 1 isoform X2 [Halichondria panicea]|uniref:fidgetin-like protein 1 isoform X2 n=1 Tax=Halichondria panicea TaxID=6063 RepID=UPI00312B6CFC
MEDTDGEEKLPTEDQLQLYLWQRASFIETGHGPSDKADSLRLKLAQLSYYTFKKKDDGEETAHLDSLSESMLEEYGQVMDERDESKGLNNYSTAVTTLAAGHENDIKTWKSELSLESVMEMPELKALLNQQKEKAIPILKRRVPFCHPLVTTVPSHSVNTTNQEAQINTQSPFQIGSPSYPINVLHDIHGGNKNTSNQVTHRPGPVVIPGWKVAKPSQKDEFRGAKRLRREKSEDDMGEEPREQAFITAGDQYQINQQKKFGGGGGGRAVAGTSYGTSKRSLGTRRTAGSRFVPPVKQDGSDSGSGSNFSIHVTSKVMSHCGSNSEGSQLPPELEGNERLKSIEPRMVELILNEIMDSSAPVQWDDIAGLHFAKESIKEIVVWPMMRPDLFTGLRGPPKGILLFGPPGTGKTLIGKCIASQVQATFFSISASSLTSKWIGEGEKMVRALFAVARCYQPAVVFIDEIDSLLSQRSDTEHESSRRIKTEFLVQLDGATTCSDDRLLVIGATNRPQEIDEAARRRLVKRLYIPLPDGPARKQIITNLMKQQPSSLSQADIEEISTKSEGYSGADMTNLCREAAYGPVREAAGSLQHIRAEEMRPVNIDDFEAAVRAVKPSVSAKDLDLYLDWNRQFGCGK